MDVLVLECRLLSHIHVYYSVCVAYADAGLLVLMYLTRSVNKVTRLPAYCTIWQYCGLALHMKVR